MTDHTPTRIVGGLAPRSTAPDLSRMLRANRNDPTTDTEGEEPAQTAQKKRTTSARPTKTVTKRKVQILEDVEPARITTYLPASLRDRAQAAYKATSHLEGDKSWSAYVERALLTETERREALYNEGEAYEGIRERLSAGRPLR